MREIQRTRPGGPPTDDERVAWDHFCRTGCIIPGYADVIARELKLRHDRDDQERTEGT